MNFSEPKEIERWVSIYVPAAALTVVARQIELLFLIQIEKHDKRTNWRASGRGKMVRYPPKLLSYKAWWKIKYWGHVSLGNVFLACK